MNDAMVVGPLVLPYSLLLALAAVASMLYVGNRSGRKAGIKVEPALWHTLLVGLVVTRLAFVWEFRSAYWASPLDVLDVRDGGWSPTAGFVGAWLFALSRQGQLPAAKKALRAALLTGGCCVQTKRAAHDAVLRRQGTAGEYANRRALGCHAE